MKVDSIRGHLMYHTFEPFLASRLYEKLILNPNGNFVHTLGKVELWCDTLGSLLGLAVCEDENGFYTESPNVSHV